MPPELLIPLAIFIALLAVFGLLLRRMWMLIVESRHLTTFRGSVRDLARRADEALDSVASQIDRVRRHQVDAGSIGPSLDGTLEALRALRGEASRLEGPAVTAAARTAFAAEIERAERALEMVEHGCAILTTPNASQRQVEAETAIKRGYLNVVHARDAIARHAADIEAARPQEELRWLTRRRNARAEKAE